MVGICRGSQFLTVMSGGRLFQDVSGHAIMGTHLIKFKDGSSLGITSTHHQMMNPFYLSKNEYDLIAVSEKNRSSKYLTEIGDARTIVSNKYTSYCYFCGEKISASDDNRHNCNIANYLEIPHYTCCVF